MNKRVEALEERYEKKKLPLEELAEKKKLTEEWRKEIVRLEQARRRVEDMGVISRAEHPDSHYLQATRRSMCLLNQ